MIMHLTHHSGRPRLVRDERGQGMVELALILPFLLLIVVGILEFGSIYSKVISMRQGVREAGRQGSVANFGSTSGCGLSLSTGDASSADIQKLMCLTKDQVGVGSNVKVRVKFAKADLTPGGSYAVGNAIVICAVYPLQSMTKLLQPVLDGHYSRTKAAFRIEKLAQPASETPGGENDPSNPGSPTSWAWCD